MKPSAMKRIIFDLIEEYGYDKVKKTIDSIFELYRILKGENKPL